MVMVMVMVKVKVKGCTLAQATGCDLVCSHWSVPDGPHGLSRVQATGCDLICRTYPFSLSTYLYLGNSAMPPWQIYFVVAIGKNKKTWFPFPFV